MTQKSRNRRRSGRKTRGGGGRNENAGVKTRRYQHEDSVLKTSMHYFADELLPYLGIEGRVEAIGPTEEVHLDITKLFQDYNFIMEDGSWKHFEFQSKNEGIPGLKRFRMYEAVTSHHNEVAVTTYVLYSGQIKQPVTEFTEGLNTYRVYPIIMEKWDADKLFEELRLKMEQGETLTKQDLVPLILSPLMGGRSSQKERVLEAYRIVKKATEVDPQDVKKIETAVYAMADKFLEEAELQELREEIRMTRLGQMLFDDGMEEGLAVGMEKGLAAGMEKGLAAGIKVVIEMSRECGEKKNKTVERIVRGFGKPYGEARQEVEKYWKKEQQETRQANQQMNV